MIHTGAAVAAGMSQGRLTPHDKFKVDCTKVRVGLLSVLSPSLLPFLLPLFLPLTFIPVSLCISVSIHICVCVCACVCACVRNVKAVMVY